MKTLVCIGFFLMFPFMLTSLSQNLLPIPASIKVESGYVLIDSSFSVSFHGKRDRRIEECAARFLARLSRQTGIPLRLQIVQGNAKLQLSWQTTLGTIRSLYDDESYSLHVNEARANLRATTFIGISRGLETFLQLVELGADGFRVPTLTIDDNPRFPWRGLLIDACRHWMPVEVIKRNLDGMALVKMNVLHWHLSEDQGFRIESKKYPGLHKLGSDGNYYSQQQVKEVIQYAADRGIRVVPEFDMPGHSTAWLVGYPDIASAPGPYQIERKWGVFDPVMDPTRAATYKFLDGFIGEMAKLFPDEYFHIGGDEVNGKQWNANPKIREFRNKNNLKDNHSLQAYFNRRVMAILKKHGKKMIGWDEIFHPDLPKDIVVQSWRGQKFLAEGAKQGYKGLLSFGYYLDLIRPASYHYSIDPVDSTVLSLKPEDQKNILGGEACMWSEYVSPENVDSRIWPRNAAVAERLWSPATTNDMDDMYRRLEITSRRLESVGLTHRTSYIRMLERLAGNHSIEPLKTLADVVEPVKGYERGKTRRYTSLTPLNRLVDAARPESNVARQFSRLTDEFLAHRISKGDSAALVGYLTAWSENHSKVQPILTGNQLLEEVAPLSKDLSDVSEIGLQLIECIRSGRKLTDDERVRFKQTIDNAGKPRAAVLLMIIPSVQKIFEATQ